jgi:hypothetical protein
LSGARGACVVGTTSGGDIAWQYHLEDSTGINSLQSTKDGGFVLCLWTYMYPIGSPGLTGPQVYWLLKFQSDGSVTWQEYCGPKGFADCATVRQTADNGYLFVGKYLSDHDFMMVRLNSAGVKSWSSQYYAFGHYYPYCFDAFELKDRSLAAVVSAAVRPYVARFDSLGTFLSLKELKVKFYPLSCQLLAGGYAIAGMVMSQSGMVVMNLDTSFEVPSCNLTMTDPTSAYNPTITFQTTAKGPLAPSVTGQVVSVNASSAFLTGSVLCSYLPPGDGDLDGVSDPEEKGPDGLDATYDGNGDGIPDWEQPNVSSFHATGGQYVTLASPPGTQLENVQPQANPSPPNAPFGMTFAYDFFGFSDSVAVGGATTVTLYLPSGANPSSYYKYGVTQGSPIPHWYEFLYDGETGAEISGNVVTLHLVDGKRGDNDLTANGIIEEPGGPAWADTTAVSVGEETGIPAVFSLSQNFPNPFNPKTAVRFQLSAASEVRLVVYDLLGREVATLVNEKRPAGSYLVTFDASSLASGTYLYRLIAGREVQIRKMVLVK